MENAGDIYSHPGDAASPGFLVAGSSSSVSVFPENHWQEMEICTLGELPGVPDGNTPCTNPGNQFPAPGYPDCIDTYGPGGGFPICVETHGKTQA